MSPRKIEKEELRKVNSINYVYVVLIFVGCILLTLYIFKWYQVKKEERLMNSYLIKTNTIELSTKDINEIDAIIQEAPSSYFIYISYREDEEVYNLEKTLKRIIDKYKINDIFYYIDITDMKKDDELYLEKIRNKLKITKLSKLPKIIYVNDGVILEDNIINVKDLEKLLKKYDFKLVK